MTAQILFARLAYVDRLKAAGFTEQQARGAAEALGEALTETVATKTDIAQLEAKIDARFNQIEDRFTQVDAGFAQVATQIAEFDASLTRWIVGVALATCTVGAAVAGFVSKHY